MVLNKKIWYARQGIYGLSGLEKTNSITFIEISGKPQSGVKIKYFPKAEGLLILKHWNISIRCLVYSKTLHC